MKIQAYTFIKVAMSLLFLATLASGRLSACDAQNAFTSASFFLKSHQYQRASGVLDEIASCAPMSDADSFQLGWLYGRAHQFQKALNTFAKVPRDVPDPMTHDYAVALSHFELDQYQLAIDLLKPDNASGTADVKSANLLAVAYSKLSLYREAYEVLSRELTKTPDDLTTHLNLITVICEGGNLPRAKEFAETARKQFPTSPDVAVLEGAINEQLGHSAEALADFTTASSLDPSRGDARFFMALVRYNEGRYPDALAILKDATATGIADPDLYYLSAECLMKLNPDNSQTALIQLDKAIDINPASVSARTLRGKLLLDSGHVSDALKDLQLAHQYDPDSRTAAYNLARAYRASGNNIEAQAIFKQLRQDSSDTAHEFTTSRLSGVLSGGSPQ